MINIQVPNTHRKIPFLLVTIAIAVFTVSMLSSCTSAGAETKKEKTKQSKPKPEPDTDETANKDETTDSETEKTPTKSANTIEPTGEMKSEHAKGSEKKDDKAKVKTADKRDNKDSKETDKVSKVSADAAWSELIRGNKRFMSGKHTGVNYSSARLSLLKSQHPDTIVLGCADSRVPPEFVFDKNLGDLFVVRDAGNIPDKLTLGSIEYAVEHLHARVLVVLGHESCGAVAAAVSGEKMPSANLSAIVDSISPSFNGSKSCIIGGDSNLSCVELNVKQSAKDILAKSAILKKAVDEGRLVLIRAVYKMGTGEVVRLD
ncbi:hypothetical protein BH10ACI2_BH10ACI2_13680 [soil metagenome]